MANPETKGDPAAEAQRSFTKALLRDLQALEMMLERGMLDGTRRFGAEQELFLVDDGLRAAPVSMDVLADLDGDEYTTELARFNLEVNVPPLDPEAGMLGRFETILEDRIQRVRAAARPHGADVCMAGILPTLAHSDLTLDNLTPKPRYQRLNEATMALAGGTIRVRIQGPDELILEQDSIMLESCNTSFQVHIQVPPDDFPIWYNAAQAALAPVLAASVNSPLLFGRRLWAETRIPLFQLSVDTRAAMPHAREIRSRVRFGDDWVRDSVVELFEEDIARLRVLMAEPVDEEPIRVLEEGAVPELQALQIHNGTIYRWNRPCYGISNGRPHLRIECRALPAGPTVADEVANFALWVGLLHGLVDTDVNAAERLDFDDVKGNFVAAGRRGLQAGFSWLDGEAIPARELLTERLLPTARRGLAGLGISDTEADRYLDIVEARVRSGQTGASWLIRSNAALREETTVDERMHALTAALIRNQHAGHPVHTWSTLDPETSALGSTRHRFLRVEHCMSTDLLTVQEDELVDLVAFLMEREQARQILVEDADHRLAGIVSYRSLLRLMARGGLSSLDSPVPVREIMETDPVSVSPETPTLEAIRLMREKGVSSLPVLKNGKLVGLVGERDFMPIAGRLLEQALAGDD